MRKLVHCYLIRQVHLIVITIKKKLAKLVDQMALKQVRAPFDNSPCRNKVLSEFQTWYKLFTLKNCQKNMLINFFGTNKLTSTNFCRLCWERARTDFCSCSAQGESMHSMPHGQANGSGQRVSQNWPFPFPPGYSLSRPVKPIWRRLIFSHLPV